MRGGGPLALSLGLLVAGGGLVDPSAAHARVRATAKPSQAAKKRKRKADEPTQIVPAKQKRRDERRQRRAEFEADPSRGGERRGVTEITLGSVSAALAGLLIARGAWEVRNGQETKRKCEEGESEDLACERPNPGNGGFIAAGLSFALVVPFAVASGFLIARGVKINRAYKAWKAHEGSVAATPLHRGAALTLRFRF